MTTGNHPTLIGGDGDGSKSALDFNSLAYIDMKKYSQSELCALSRSSSNGNGTENDVVLNFDSDSDSDHRPNGSTATPRRIFAFSHRRRVSGDDGDGDVRVTEDKLILQSLQRLVAEGEAYDSKDMVAVGEAQDSRDTAVEMKKKRTRKRKGILNGEDEYEGMSVINVNGEVIDLKYVACDGDNVFECELNKKTEGMAKEDEFLVFLSGLEGRWGSTRRRRKYVDAAVFVKVLPVGWRVLLSLRPRVRQPSLYCRRFVSPSDEHFKSCKDVAFYLKSQFATRDANPPEVDLESGAPVHRSSHPASKNDILETNNVPTHNLIKCNICRDSFTSAVELESHLQKYHRNDNQSLDMDALTRKRSVPCGLLLVREPKYPLPIIQNSVKQNAVVEDKDTVTRRNELKDIPVNEEGSSNEQNNNSEGKGNLKTRCVWCLVEFIREPVDAETLASSSGFMCSKCKEVASRNFESALSRLTKRADN